MFKCFRELIHRPDAVPGVHSIEASIHRSAVLVQLPLALLFVVARRACTQAVHLNKFSGTARLQQ